MATITSKDVIDKIIAANGYQYDDEPPVVRIVEYVDQGGKTVWGTVWSGDDNPYRYDRETEFIHNPQVIFNSREAP